jgi:hypothetical protein
MPQPREKINASNFKYLWIVPAVFCFATILQVGSKVALARPFTGSNLAPAGDPVEKQRGWRRGRPSDQGRGQRGNESSERPKRPAQFGRPERDRNREDKENQREQATNGCPDNTMSIAMAPDNLSFSVLYDQFIAKTQASQRGQGGRQTLVRCLARVPIDIPDGMRMAITRIDYRGYANVPAGSVASLRSAYAFVGANSFIGMRPDNGRGRGGPNRGMGDAIVNFDYNFSGPVDEEYLLSSTAFTEKDAVSPCGGSAVLALRNVLRIRNQKPADATVTVDSMDGKGELVYYVRWESCTP